MVNRPLGLPARPPSVFSSRFHGDVIDTHHRESVRCPMLGSDSQIPWNTRRRTLRACPSAHMDRIKSNGLFSSGCGLRIYSGRSSPARPTAMLAAVITGVARHKPRG